MWLTRVRITEDGALKSLRPVVMPASDAERISVSHRLLWSLFPDSEKADENWRPFLWREEAAGAFIILSDCLPRFNGLLELVDQREFKPDLADGQFLRFRLRANPVARREIEQTRRTVSKKSGRERIVPIRVKDDVVMKAIESAENGARASARNQQLGWGEDEDGKPLPLKAPRDWLDRQGGEHGFEVHEAVALGYQTLRVPRADGRKEKRPMRIGIVELDGLLQVTDPEAFLSRLPLGFGSAKAFGCGLMLIRRA